MVLAVATGHREYPLLMTAAGRRSRHTTVSRVVGASEGESVMRNRGLLLRSSAVAGAFTLIAAVLVSLVSASPTAAANGPVVSIGDAETLEPDSNYRGVLLPITLSKPAESLVTVSYYTADGSAVEGDDYYRNGSPANPRADCDD